jgi:antirestriction protein ArdC
MSSKVYQILTDNILKMIDAGTAPWLKPWKASDAPRNISGRHYRGINTFVLAMVGASRGYTDSVWMTFNHIKANGGTIKAGEEKRHTPVYLWNWVKRKDGTGDDDTFPIFRFYLVWNIAQVDGIELPAREPAREVNMIDAAQAIVDGMPNRPAMAFGGDRAYYAPALDKVVLPLQTSFKGDEEYYHVCFHELAHSTGHKSRLNRKEVDQPTYHGSHDYSLEELVAELTACFLSSEAGIGDRVVTNAAAYLDGWSKALRHDPKMFATAAARAQKAADYILNRTEEKVESGD